MNSNLVVMTLGSAQDGGYPHIGCRKECCESAWLDLSKRRLVASLAIIDISLNHCWIIDASPDIKYQLNMISDFLGLDKTPEIKGIFLTHAHTGHYSGLLELGKEALNLYNVPLYAMPRMFDFIKSNKAFDFLIRSKNISLKPIQEKQEITLRDNTSISSFLVPHRNEMSETVGYKINSNQKSAIYIPDIDSWSEWDNSIVDLIKHNDYLFIDGTFYDKKEIQGRDVSEIPHPSIIDSLVEFSGLESKDKNKIFFTHLNHTNIIIKENNPITISLLNEGYNIVSDGETFYI